MNRKAALDWLRFAEKDLKIAQISATHGEFDMAAYHCQQSVEKSLKCIIVYLNINPPRKDFRTHNIATLLTIIKNHGINIPPEILPATNLTDYAFTTRYPDDYVPVSKTEYEEAYQIAKKVLKWAQKIIG